MNEQTANGPATVSEYQTPSEKSSWVGKVGILILSGFLLGMATQQHVPPAMQILVLLAGATGLIALLAMGLVSQCRHHSAQRRATTQLERRIDRHVPHPPEADERSLGAPSAESG